MSKVLRRRMVDELVRKNEKAKNFILVSGDKMTANQAVELRRELRSEKAKLTVLKNSVAHHAFEKLGLKEFQKHLSGMNALVAAPDAVTAAKKVVAFRDKNDRAQVKAGYLEGKPLTAADVAAMSKMPGRAELLSMLLGTMQAPAQQFVNVVNESVRQFVNVMAAHEAKLKEQKA